MSLLARIHKASSGRIDIPPKERFLHRHDYHQGVGRTLVCPCGWIEQYQHIGPIDAELGQPLCGYGKPWGGPCTSIRGECEQHKDAKCFKCGEPATHGCDHVGLAVCGKDCCDEHKHRHYDW